MMDERSRTTFSDQMPDSDERQTKRREGNANETLERDRISAMPDPILAHILSFLPTKEAVKTGTLSHRWLYVWTYVTKLNFIDEYDCSTDFVKIVDQTLIFHSGCNIREFEACFNYDNTFATSVDRWIRFATRGNVEELSLNLYNENHDPNDLYLLPQHVYKNSSIMKLNLEACGIVPNGTISWKSLKSLSIRETRLSEDVIQKILGGSPVLEFLELEGFDGFTRLNIGLASLRKLVLRNHRGAESSWLEISAPNLHFLIIEGNMNKKITRLMNIQSLVDCNLSFYDDKIDYGVHPIMVKQLLGSLGHVKNLIIGTWVLRALSGLQLDLKGSFCSPLSKCQSLILDFDGMEDCLFGIAGLVQNSLSLETLVIKMTMTIPFWLECRRFLPNLNCDFSKYWILRKASFDSLLHLKIVKVVGSLEWRCMFEIVKFLLDKASGLEKMVLSAQRGSPEELHQLAEKLLALPRSSLGAKVYVTD